jgi:hypothetical protein
VLLGVLAHPKVELGDDYDMDCDGVAMDYIIQSQHLCSPPSIFLRSDSGSRAVMRIERR